MSDSKNSLIQRSLVLFKPDAVQRGVVGEILSRFERVGLKIVGTKMFHPDRGHYYKHYEDIGKMITRRGEKIFNDTLDYMNQGPVIAMVFEGVEAVSVIRKIVGTTEPKVAAAGTIRGDYSHLSIEYGNSVNAAIPNLIHASGDPEEAKLEIAHWFKENELFDYTTLSEKFTFAKYGD
ncbi:MAG: nucleoside-diphosphate kinase [Deltaproteobacteria bacterium]|jgi:nucleoside-diphosphate kinase|nr:nucleoside-diphosphate kinase [Deltaproteobacteria bacterium]